MPPRRSSHLASSADLHAAVAHVTSDVLALLGDGWFRAKRTILAALADRHPKNGVKRTLMRLAVTERLVEKDGKHTLATVETDQDGAPSHTTAAWHWAVPWMERISRHAKPEGLHHGS